MNPDADQRNLLGQALGNLLVALGVVNDVPLTGPELLLHAQVAAAHFTANPAVGLLRTEGTDPPNPWNVWREDDGRWRGCEVMDGPVFDVRCAEGSDQRPDEVDRGYMVDRKV